MPVLLIGGGLVGSQVANILVSDGEDVTVLDYAPQPEALAENVDVNRLRLVRGDVLSPLSIVDALRESRADSVVHTAAYPMLTIGAQQNPYGAIQINIMGTVNVLEAARTMGVERVVVVSSGVLSQSLTGGGDSNDPAFEEAFPRPSTFYAATKQAVESLATNYAAWCGVDVRAVRYAAIAGPWSGRGGGGPSNMFRDLVEGALLKGEIEVPSRSLEWVYSKDAARGTVLALKADNLTDRVFNIGMGRITSPKELADAITEALPETNANIAPPDPSGAAMFNAVALNLDRSKAALGYEPHFDVPACVRDYIEWFGAKRM